MKSSCVAFACPSCNTNYEVFMKRSPQLMIISCPSCKCSISVCDGQTQVINEILTSQIENAESRTDLMSVLNDICKTNEHQTDRLALTADDVLDLRIGLQSCKSFDDVMDIVCKAQ